MVSMTTVPASSDTASVDTTSTDTATGPAVVSLTVEENLASVLDMNVIYQLRKFRHDNTITYLRGRDSASPTLDDPPADDREVYDLLVFAARNIGRDLTLPRSLEALRVVKLVPEDIGAAIFAKIERH